MRRWWKTLAGVAALAGCGSDSYDLDGGDQVTVGQAFVAQRKCGDCHQPPGDGDGVLSGQTDPVTGSSAYGGNLTPDHATGIGDWADVEVVRAIRYGVDNHQMKLCPEMPRYDGSDGGMPFMTDLEANAIVAYLRSLPPVRRAAPGSICPPIKVAPLDFATTDDAGAADDAGAGDAAVPADGGAD